jgi:cytochrome c biogenesis protein CcmG/thiol:disulfide interchange protein DsbE
MKKLGWRITPFLIFTVLALFLGRGLFLEPQNLPSAQIGKSLPDFQLPQLLAPGKSVTPQHFSNKVVLLNVWASWCAACVQEQVFMLKLAKEGVLIYGLNYQDDPEAAKRWLDAWGNPYHLIAADRNGRLAIDLGVYGAPETFLIDKQGLIRYRHVGILTEAVWNKELLLLKKVLEAEI